MKRFSDGFLIGASTAAHQVEGNNIHSDFWAMENMEHTLYKEPSGEAVDHYHRYREDIDLMANSGLNAYRFSIEWARIEPRPGQIDEAEITHYRDVIKYCHTKGITPVVTMHHFSSPRWLIAQGGWEDERTINAFSNYCAEVVKRLGDQLEYVCTINEANMGLQIASIASGGKEASEGDIQVGMNAEAFNPMQEFLNLMTQENKDCFGVEMPQTFFSPRTASGDRIIMRAHETARDAMKRICPHLKIGLTLSLFDYHVQPGGEENAQMMWDSDFAHYLPALQKDDFIGVQNYTRRVMARDGIVPVPDDAHLTLMRYEYYPEGLGHVVSRVYRESELPILITENGIATADDEERIAYMETALEGVQKSIEGGSKVLGYLHWSLLDNFEWMAGYDPTFGLIAVDRKTQNRYPKKSLSVLGKIAGNPYERKENIHG